jgi:hypothetical protein
MTQDDCFLMFRTIHENDRSMLQASRLTKLYIAQSILRFDCDPMVIAHQGWPETAEYRKQHHINLCDNFGPDAYCRATNAMHAETQ